MGGDEEERGELKGRMFFGGDTGEGNGSGVDGDGVDVVDGVSRVLPVWCAVRR